MTRPLIEQWLPAAGHRRREPPRARQPQGLPTDQFPPRLVGAATLTGQPRSSARFAASGLANRSRGSKTTPHAPQYSLACKSEFPGGDEQYQAWFIQGARHPR